MRATFIDHERVRQFEVAEEAPPYIRLDNSEQSIVEPHQAPHTLKTVPITSYRRECIVVGDYTVVLYVVEGMSMIHALRKVMDMAARKGQGRGRLIDH